MLGQKLRKTLFSTEFKIVITTFIISTLLFWFVPVGSYAADLCGDADGNGSVDIDDIVYLIDHIFQGGPAPSTNCCGQGGCLNNNDCAINETCCNGTCVDTQADEAHCGNCNTPCPQGWTCCNGTCVDTQNDNNNCGGCGIVCPQGFVCQNGICVQAPVSEESEETDSK